MVKTSKEELAKKRQNKLIQHLKKEDSILKWALVAAGIIILLLLLYIGYATDWIAGIKTDSSTQPIILTPNSSKTATGTDTGSTGGTGTNNTSRTNTGTTGTNSTTNNTTKETTTTTTTNNTTGTDSTVLDDTSSALVKLYNGTKVGDSLDTIINRATDLGIGVDCQDMLLVRTCTLTAGDSKVQVRGLLSTGTVTSLLNLGS
jgi:hypothetical protein